MKMGDGFTFLNCNPPSPLLKKEGKIGLLLPFLKGGGEGL